MWLYRKHFDAPSHPNGTRVFLDFAGAMTGASITLNGHDLASHVGGYLPFTAELTAALRPAGNVLGVVLDATFNQDVPPNQPAPAASSSVAYWQPGGIYRDVTLRVVPQVFLADLFAKPVDVLHAAQRRVAVQFTVDAGTVPAGAVTVRIDLRDGSRRVASTTVPVMVTTTGQVTGTASLRGLDSIRLWDVDAPKLYEVVATLSVSGAPIHAYHTSIGFRQATFTRNGFFLNGRRVKLFGVNRHQTFPFGGEAMPDRIQRRDVQILRNELNCNMVRCSHYPQSEAFLDACDQLGLMVWQEMPGWRYFGDDAWQQAGYQDIHDMIVRDRNHPSIVIWGAMPNEAGEQVPEYTLYNQLAHSLDDSRPTGGDGSPYDPTFPFDVLSVHDYTGIHTPDGLRVPTLADPTDAAGKPYLVCESVGSLSGPALFYRRTDPQWVQQGQAKAHAAVQSIAGSNDGYCGLLAWSGFHYHSGFGNEFQGIMYTGVVDTFRVPMPGAAIYQAQVDPKTRPVITPAFYWDFGPTSPINHLGPAMICSNLERLEVYVAGRHFATVTPAAAEYPGLRYPPSFVDFTSVSGHDRPELRIDGFRGGKRVASERYSSDPSRDRLAMTVDDDQLTANGSDATRVSLRAVDKYGHPRPYVTGDVSLGINGPSAIVGDNPFPLGDTGGAGAVWLRTLANSPGTVTITASHPTLGRATRTLRVKTATPGSAPDPCGTLRASGSTVLAPAAGEVMVGARFTNTGPSNLHRLTLRLDVPSGWSATPTTRVTFDSIRHDGAVNAAWRVAVPDTAQPGFLGATVTASFRGHAHDEIRHDSTALMLTVPYPSLRAAFNNLGISDELNPPGANLDGVGISYSRHALAAAGFAPATGITQSGVTFTWPDVPVGQPDNALAEGQTVLISGSGSTLGFLGAGTPSAEGGTGTVHYTDGTASNFTVVLDGYLGPASTTGNVAIATMRHVNDAEQAAEGGPVQLAHTARVFYTGVRIDAKKKVRAVTLPTGGVIPPNGPITGMHIFAIGVGG